MAEPECSPLGCTWFMKITTQELDRIQKWCGDLQKRADKLERKVTILWFASGVLGTLALALTGALISKWVN